MPKAKIFAVDVTIYATAYVRAYSAKKALDAAHELSMTPLQVEGEGICGLRLVEAAAVTN